MFTTCRPTVLHNVHVSPIQHLDVQNGVADDVPGTPLVCVPDNDDRRIYRLESREGFGVICLTSFQEVRAGFGDQYLDLRGTGEKLYGCGVENSVARFFGFITGRIEEEG